MAGHETKQKTNAVPSTHEIDGFGPTLSPPQFKLTAGAPFDSNANGAMQRKSDEKTPPGKYIVKKGDTLSAIAKQYQVTTSDLAIWNQLKNPNNIEVGQMLIVTDPKKASDRQKFDTYPIDNGDYNGSGWAHDERQKLANGLGMDNNVSSVFEAGIKSQLQFGHLNIVGEALDKIKSDPAIASYGLDIYKQLKANPKFGKLPFYDKGYKVVEFGGERAPGSMIEQLKGFWKAKYKKTRDVATNELTWLVRHATVRWFAEVDANGNISCDFHLNDTFDLRGNAGRSGEYNAISDFLGFLYHDLAGGNDKLVLKAEWNVKVPKQK